MGPLKIETKSPSADKKLLGGEELTQHIEHKSEGLINTVMTLSGPTKLRSTNGNSWHKLPPHKHRIRSKGDYRLPRVRGVTRVSLWWADGGARRSLALSLSGAYYCHCRQETSLHMQTLVSHSTKWQRIDMVLRSGGVGSLAGRVLSGSPFSGGCGGAPRVRRRLVPPDGGFGGGAAAVIWLHSPRTRTIVTVVKRQVSTCRHSS